MVIRGRFRSLTKSFWTCTMNENIKHKFQLNFVNLYDQFQLKYVFD